MTINSITINLQDKQPIEVNKVTDLTSVLFNYDEEEEFVITTVEINYNN